MAQAPVYLDCHATTPVDPRVVEAMLPYFTEVFGNPSSSTHQWGWRAQTAVEQARREVASIIGASAREIVFTGGATESNNLAVRGVAARLPQGRRHLVISAIEHKSVIEVGRRLERDGWQLTIVPVDAGGIIDLAELDRAVTDGTGLVSVMAANNEIGTLQPIGDVGRIAKARGALLHVDAAQAVGRVPVDVSASGVDLLSLTAHKIYGPKGTGALYVRRKLDIEPVICGGGHERGLRAGTLNVPGIVGLGRACAVAQAEMATEAPRIARLRDRLLQGLQRELDGVVVNGSRDHRLANNLHVSFDGVDGESLIIGISDIAVSSGSACSSASGTPSHVLAAILHGAKVPSASIRFGLGRFTTEAEIDYTISKFASVVRHLRQVAPV